MFFLKKALLSISLISIVALSTICTPVYAALSCGSVYSQTPDISNNDPFEIYENLEQSKNKLQELIYSALSSNGNSSNNLQRSLGELAQFGESLEALQQKLVNNETINPEEFEVLNSRYLTFSKQ
jgi:hypothetical protein